jgi:hypothetical protein
MEVIGILIAVAAGLLMGAAILLIVLLPLR